MSDYSCIYEDDTGEILVVAETSELPSPATGQSVYTGDADPMVHYILAGVRTDRTVVADLPEYSVIADGTDSVVIALPDATVVTDLSDSAEYTSSGVEDFEFTSTIVGVFEFAINPPFPAIPAVIRIFANADS